MIDPKRTLLRYRLIEEALKAGELSVADIYTKVQAIAPETTKNIVKGYVDKLRENKKAHICQWKVAEYKSTRGLRRCWIGVVKWGDGENAVQPRKLPSMSGSTGDQATTYAGFGGGKRIYADLPMSFFAKSA